MDGFGWNTCPSATRASLVGRKLFTKPYRRHFDFLACSKAELALHFVRHMSSPNRSGIDPREVEHSGKSPQRTSADTDVYYAHNRSHFDSSSLTYTRKLRGMQSHDRIKATRAYNGQAKAIESGSPAAGHDNRRKRRRDG
jgi:hypothetical protein